MITIGIPPNIIAQPQSQTVVVAETATFTVTATGTQPLNYQWRKGGTNLAGATAVTFKIPSVLFGDAGNYSVLVSNVHGWASSSNALLTVVPPITLPEALDTPDWSWLTGGQAAWSGQAFPTHDGVDAARSGLIIDNQETWLETTISNGPGTLTFWWKVSCENGYDFLELYRNGVVQTNRISGEVDWQLVSVPVPTGSQVFHWRYIKDGSLASGQDRAWLDEVSFAPTPLRLLAVELENGRLMLLVGNSEGSPVTPEQATRIRICATTNLTLPFGQWTTITNPFVLSNGWVHVAGLQTTNMPQLFLRGYLEP